MRTLALIGAFFSLCASALARDVTVTVTSPLTGQPVSGVTVVATNGSNGTTNADGTAVITADGATNIAYSARVYDGGWGCEGSAPTPTVANIAADQSRLSVSTSVIPEVSGPTLSSPEARLVEIINRARSEAGIGPVQEVSRLSQVAAIQSTATDVQPNRIGQYLHLGFSCERLLTRAREAGIVPRDGYVATGEIMTAGVTDPEVALAKWRASEGHWRELMHPSFTAVGVGEVGGIWTVDLYGPTFDVVGDDLSERRTSPSGWSAEPGPSTMPSTPEEPIALAVDRPDMVRYGQRVLLAGSSAGPVSVAVRGRTISVVPDVDGTWGVRVKARASGPVVVTSGSERVTTALRVKPLVRVSVSRRGVGIRIRPAGRARLRVVRGSRTVLRRSISNTATVRARLHKSDRVIVTTAKRGVTPASKTTRRVR